MCDADDCEERPSIEVGQHDLRFRFCSWRCLARVAFVLWMEREDS